MMYRNLKILITFCVVLLLCNQNCKAWRAFKVILTTGEYQFNTNLLDAKIQIVNNNTADSMLNIVVTTLEDIDDVTLSYGLAIEGEQANNFTLLMQRKVEFCKFLQQRTIDNVLRSLYDDISKQGSFIKACPLKKSIVYTLRDYHVDEELLPQYVPEANFYADIQLDKSNGDMLLKGRLYGKIDKSKGFNNLKMFSMG